MVQVDPASIQNISDTAIWAAVYRARENEKPRPLFRDPFARRLVGSRGDQIADAMPSSNDNTWAWVTRTYLFDQFITERVAGGADMVINLAAGLDARPYRMALPASLQWVEIDLPGILDYKSQILAGDKPACSLERVPLDLSDVSARREVFSRLGSRAKNALVVTEGLIIYFPADEVAALARDLSAQPGFAHWALDVASPGLLKLLQRELGPKLVAGGARLQFGPPEGPPFFSRYGWSVADVRGMLKTAAKVTTVPFFLRLGALFPESKGAQGGRPWSGICLLSNEHSA